MSAMNSLRGRKVIERDIYIYKYIRIELGIYAVYTM